MSDSQTPEYSQEFDAEDEPKVSPEKRERLEALDVLANGARSLVEEAVELRNASSFKQDIQKSYQLYNATGVSTFDLDEDWEGTRTQLKEGSKVVQNIIRQICNDGASQLGDLLYPTDDHNYALKPVLPSKPPLAIKYAEAVDEKGQFLAVVDDGQGGERPITNQEAWEARVEQLRYKAGRMFEKIDGTMNRIQIGRIGRAAIDQAGRTGTGIIKGPFVDPKKDRKWAKKSSTWSLEEDNRQQAAYKNVQVLDFFPDLTAECIEDCAYVNERAWYLPRQLNALLGLGYEDDQIRRLLSRSPEDYTSAGLDSDDDRRAVKKDTAVAQEMYSKRYEVWETWAEVSRSTLEKAKVQIPDKLKEQDTVLACVIHSNGIVLKAFVAKQQCEFPYSVWCWDEDPTSIFGKSIPILAENCQLSYNATWRMMLDHGGLSATPMIAMIKAKVSPADGTSDYSLRGGKVWNVESDVFDVNGQQGRPFEVFDIPAHLDQYFALLDRAEEDAYKLTGVTRVDKNETNAHPDNAPLTLGATQIFQNNASVSRRRQVRNFDDKITKTVMTRQYNWHMEFDSDDSYKEVMEIEPRGAGLLQREMNTQNLLLLLQLSGEDPAAKRPDILREVQRHMQFADGRFIETKEETERREKLEAENPQVPVEVQLEEARQASAMAEVERKRERDEADTELAQQRLQLDAQERDARLQLEVIDKERTHYREMLRLQMLSEQDANKHFRDLQSQQSKLMVDLEKIQTARDVEASKRLEKETESERKFQIEAVNAQARDRDSRTKEAELSNKLSGNIETGV